MVKGRGMLKGRGNEKGKGDGEGKGDGKEKGDGEGKGLPGPLSPFVGGPGPLSLSSHMCPSHVVIGLCRLIIVVCVTTMPSLGRAAPPSLSRVWLCCRCALCSSSRCHAVLVTSLCSVVIPA